MGEAVRAAHAAAVAGGEVTMPLRQTAHVDKPGLEIDPGLASRREELRGQGLAEFVAADGRCGAAVTVMTGTLRSFEERVVMQKLAVTAAIEAFRNAERGKAERAAAAEGLIINP